MSTYGYSHSTNDNPEQAHHYEILYFGVNNRLGQVHFSHEPVADRFHGGKPVLSGMVDNFQREDVLIVTDFSKLSYSTVEVLGVLSGLSRTGVRLYVINSGFRLGDNMQSQVVAMACFLVSQIEQDLGSSWLTATLVHEQPEVGTVVGSDRRTRKSKMDSRRPEIESLLASGISPSKAARTLEVSRPALTDYINSRNLPVQIQSLATLNRSGLTVSPLAQAQTNVHSFDDSLQRLYTLETT